MVHAPSLRVPRQGTPRQASPTFPSCFVPLMSVYQPLASLLAGVCIALNVGLVEGDGGRLGEALDSQTAAAQAQARYALAQTILGGAGLVGTLVLLYYTRESLEVSREAANVARDAVELTRLEQRAWLGVASVGLRLPTEGDLLTAVELSFTNSGSTPALNVVLATRLTRLPTTSVPIAQLINPALLEWPQGEAPYAAVALPGVPFKNLLVGPTETTLNALIRDGHGTLCVFGEIRYQDVFARPHTTSFAYWYNPATAALDAVTMHNSAT